MDETQPEKEIAFGLGIRPIYSPDGKGVLGWNFQSVNKNVPAEIVITQLRAFLRKLENDYFDNFDKSFTQGTVKKE